MNVDAYDTLAPRTRPSRLVRYGVWCMFGFVVVLFTLASAIPQRAIISAPVRVTEPGVLRASTTGRLHLLVSPSTIVREGQVIGFVESSATPVTLIYVPVELATLIQAPQSATLNGGGEQFPIRIDAVLPAVGDSVPLRVTGAFDLPPASPAILTIHGRESRLLELIMRSFRR